MSYEMVMSKLNTEYNVFKQHELTKNPEDIFQDAFKISSFEQSLWLFEQYTQAFETSIPNLYLKLLQTEDLLEYVYLETLGYDIFSLDENDFHCMLHDLFTDN